MPVIEALDIVAANAGNQIVADALVGAQEGVREGKTLSAVLARYTVMPVMVTQMIETGEESGALDDMLDKVATFYDNEVNATVDSLTSILEPLIIVFMGACIGCIVVSLYLPMFDYVNSCSSQAPSLRMDWRSAADGAPSSGAPAQQAKEATREGRYSRPMCVAPFQTRLEGPTRLSRSPFLDKPTASMSREDCSTVVSFSVSGAR